MSYKLPDEINGPYYIESQSKFPLEGEIVNGYHLDFGIDNTFFSIVFLGSKPNETEKKILKFIKRREENLELIVNELTAMTIVKHKRILRMENYFPYNEYVCIVTPFAKYGTLRDFISNEFPCGIDEDLARIIMKQIIEGLMNIHSANFIHRDIKPNNILITNNDINGFQVVISDLGLAKQNLPGEKDDIGFATNEYAAPEIHLNKSYDFSSDVWSLGITLFMMLSGTLPFRKRGCKCFIINGDLNYDLLHDISIEGIQFIKSMCQVDPQKRISLDSALKNPWVIKGQKASEIEQDTYNYINTRTDIQTS